MIIGVDAGALSVADERLKVGVWRVTYNLLRELAAIDRTNEYRLYAWRPIPRFSPRMKPVLLPERGWSKFWLPLALARRPVDVFLGLSQMLPKTTARTVGFVHDVGFLHYPDAYPDSYSRLKKQTEQLIRVADTIVTFSRATARDIRHADVRVVYEGVDGHFSRRGNIHRETHPYVLFVGAIKRIKNVPQAIRIFRKFRDLTKKPYNLIIIGGDYWLDPEIGSISKHEHVAWKGFVSDRELAAYYRGAHALLVTSKWEGFCLPAVEAAASGCPVVFANAGALPEIMGRKGFTTEAEAVRALGSPKKPPVYNRSWREFARQLYDEVITQRSAHS